jgi:hypothetical protein
MEVTCSPASTHREGTQSQLVVPTAITEPVVSVSLLTKSQRHVLKFGNVESGSGQKVYPVIVVIPNGKEAKEVRGLSFLPLPALYLTLGSWST